MFGYRLLLIFSCLYLVIDTIQGETQEACDKTELSISCAADELIVIEHAHYGRSNTRTCAGRTLQNRDTSCSADNAFAVVTSACFGRSSCSILVVMETFGVDPCPGTNKYLSVEYYCVPPSNIMEACGTGQINSEWGYFISPHYPQNFDNGKNCVTDLKAQPGQLIRATLLDLELEARDTTGCYDWLTLTDPLNPAQHFDYCGNMKSIKEPTENIFRRLNIRFRPDAMHSFRGFLLKFEAVSDDGTSDNNPNQAPPSLKKILVNKKAIKLPEANQQQVKAEPANQIAPDSGELKIQELKKTLDLLEKQHKESALKKQREAEEKRKEEEEKRRKEEEERKRIEEEEERQNLFLAQEEERKRQIKEIEEKELERQRALERQAADYPAPQWQRHEVAPRDDETRDGIPPPAGGGVPREFAFRAGLNHGGFEAPRGSAKGCSRDALDVPEHGYVVTLKEGKRAEMACNSGYSMADEDDGMLVCHGNAWAGNPGKCVAIDCGSPEVPAHGEVIYRHSTAGSDAEFLCHKNYRLVGNTQITCLENGQWSGLTPYCAVPGGRNLSLFGEVLIAIILTILLMFCRKRCPRMVTGFAQSIAELTQRNPKVTITRL